MKENNKSKIPSPDVGYQRPEIRKEYTNLTHPASDLWLLRDWLFS